MKITPKNLSADAILDYPNDGMCSVSFQTWTCDQVRVIEFPKVWRYCGKQYKVVDCLYRNWGDPVSVIIRVPHEATLKVMDADYKEERY